MARLVLHIGMEKTGSTALQVALSRSAADDFVYPQLGEAPFARHHTDALVSLFSKRGKALARKKRDLGKPLNAGTDDDSRIRRAAEEAQQAPVILSSEGAYRNFDANGLTAMKRFFDELFDDILVIGYVREPVALISSSFWRRIEGSGLSEFRIKYKPYRPFQLWDQAFGRENVRLSKFDRDAFPNRSVVDHFTALAGIRPIESSRVNETLSLPAVSAMYLVNRVVGDFGQHRESIREIRGKLRRQFPHEEWPKFRLSPRLIEPLLDANPKDFWWIEQRLGSSLRVTEDCADDDIACEEDLMKIDPTAVELMKGIGGTLSPDAAALLARALDGAASSR